MKSEEKFRRIVETTGEGFLMMDEKLNIIDVNNAYCAMLGYEREEILGKERLCRIIRNHAEETAEAIVSRVYEEINRFTIGLPRQDDITLVVIKTA